MVMNGMFYVVVEQDVASVVNASLALTLEMDPYFDGELYGAYSSYEQAADHANQVNL
jgi:hypothetical protein